MKITKKKDTEVTLTSHGTMIVNVIATVIRDMKQESKEAVHAEDVAAAATLQVTNTTIAPMSQNTIAKKKMATKNTNPAIVEIITDQMSMMTATDLEVAQEAANTAIVDSEAIAEANTSEEANEVATVATEAIKEAVTLTVVEIAKATVDAAK